MSSKPEPIRPIYALVGESLFLRREALGRILAAARAEAHGSAQVTTLDGREAKLADALDEVRTVSMFADRRIVVVDEAEAFLSRHREGIERFVQSPAEGGTLVLLSKALDRRTRLSKALLAAGAVVECEPLKGAAVLGWINRRIRDAYGKTLAPRAAASLRDLTGDDLGILDMELAKLATYVGPRAEISFDDVAELVGSTREENVFALLDAVADGNAAAALERWRQVLATDAAAKDRSIGGLSWGVRQLLEAHRARSRGESLVALARRMWTDAGVLEQRLNRTTGRRLELQLSGLLAVDLAVKSGGATIASGVERWIINQSLLPPAAMSARPRMGTG